MVVDIANIRSQYLAYANGTDITVIKDRVNEWRIYEKVSILASNEVADEIDSGTESDFSKVEELLSSSTVIACIDQSGFNRTFFNTGGLSISYASSGSGFSMRYLYLIIKPNK